MKIADFFIALGFKVDGEPELEKADQAVQKTEFSTLKLLGAVTALNAAWWAMLRIGTQVGEGLQRFTVTTGLAGTELQRYQALAVRGNVAASNIVNAIGAIQKARAAIAFGNAEAAAPWMLLGIDPRQDPFKVLEQLRLQVQRLDPAIARQKLGEMGFGEDVFYLLRQQGLGRATSDPRLTVSDAEAERLTRLAASWKVLLYTAGQAAARFAAQFAEPLAAILTQLTKALELVGRLVDWMDRGSSGATAFKYGVLAVVTALTGLNVALGFLLLGPAGAFLALLSIMAVALGTLVLLIQDFWVACRGGKTAFDWNENLLLTVKNVERLARAIGWVIDQWKKLDGAKLGNAMAFAQGGGFGVIPGPGGIGLTGAGPVTQTNNVNVSVQGGSDPHATGRDVGRAASRQISDAFAQMPAP